MIQNAILNGHFDLLLNPGRLFLVAPDATDQARWLASLYPQATKTTTLQAADDAMVSGRGDIAIVADGEYDETFAPVKNNARWIAAALNCLPRAIIKRTVLNAACLNIGETVKKLDFAGIGFECNISDASKHAVRSKGDDIDFFGCKFSGDGGIGLLIQDGEVDGGARNRVVDSEFEFSDRGLMFAKSAALDVTTQHEIRGCRFHNMTTRAIGRIDAVGSVKDAWIIGNHFLQNEDGSEPTKYIELDGAEDIVVCVDNTFATANQTSGKMLVSAASKWLKNFTVAGVSAGAPS